MVSAEDHTRLIKAGKGALGEVVLEPMRQLATVDPGLELGFSRW